MKRILVVGAADTRGEELAYLRTAITDAGAVALVVDVGEPKCAVDIPRSQVAASGSDASVLSGDRGAAVAAMGEAFAGYLAGAGGSMRSLESAARLPPLPWLLWREQHRAPASRSRAD